MLDSKYVQYGIDALCRAHRMNYFTDGHRGAAMIAAYCFCREVEVEQGAADLIGASIDQQWSNTPLCEPFPPGAYEASGIDRILECLERSMDYMRQAGHNVIFPALALKAFHHFPDLLTEARVDGLCKLIEAFTINEPLSLDQDDEQVDFEEASDIAEYILSEMLTVIDAFEGRGQGWSGHLLTYGRALIDIKNMGYGKTAKRGEHGFNLYIKRIRMGPLETDKPRPEHPQSVLLPVQREYWQQRVDKSLNLGHSIKYPYGFYGLVDLARDETLINQCLDKAYHIF
ncbi:MAG: hypothetical protein P1S60_15965 [Anaerolineae bacterium]|nr:hypothetical protein [Anaerolineae bacterium]